MLLLTGSLSSQEDTVEEKPVRTCAEILQELRSNISAQEELIGIKDSIISSNVAVIEELHSESVKLAEELELSVQKEAEANKTIVSQNEKLRIKNKWLTILSLILTAFVLSHILILFLKAKWNITLPYWLNAIL